MREAPSIASQRESSTDHCDSQLRSETRHRNFFFLDDLRAILGFTTAEIDVGVRRTMLIPLRRQQRGHLSNAI